MYVLYVNNMLYIYVYFLYLYKEIYATCIVYNMWSNYTYMNINIYMDHFYILVYGIALFSNRLYRSF